MAKYIFVAGGVISGTGKGVSAASIGLLLRQRGFTVEIIKFDPYLNVNAGILAPREHGECFLCDDGTETDLDLGHYSRIAGIDVSARNICTSGTLMKELVREQERGDYLGQTVQFSPHVTDKIKKRLLELGKTADIVIAEIGGTVGDPESDAFYEAVQQFKHQHDESMLILVAPILWINTIKEFKTKPLQNAVKELRTYGLQPDVLLCRVDRPVPPEILDKVSNLTAVPRSAVLEAPDVETIYHVPIELYQRNIDDLCCDLLRLKRSACRLQKYKELVTKTLSGVVNIGVIGKYVNSDEAYISLKESLFHSGLAESVKVNIHWISAMALEQKSPKEVKEMLEPLDAVIVPGGFDSRGIEGKIRAIRFARENKVPFLGLCLGLQCAVIEFGRNVCGLEGANSLEFDKDAENPVVHYVKGQDANIDKSATMRLGAFDCELAKGSLAADIYGKRLISERHRHRLEVNPEYTEKYAQKGFRVTGVNPGSNLVEMMELDRAVHPYFIGTQAHPEFKSRLAEPAPLFKGLVHAAVEFHKQRNSQ